jgi:hypothetical protein
MGPVDVLFLFKVAQTAATGVLERNKRQISMLISSARSSFQSIMAAINVSAQSCKQNQMPLGGFLRLFSFKTIVQELKSKPGAHLTSFLILHEVTALVPIPIIYLLLGR